VREGRRNESQTKILDPPLSALAYAMEVSKVQNNRNQAEC
jgi:hypothetical protein